MTGMNWDKVRRENLSIKHGTERIGEDLPPDVRSNRHTTEHYHSDSALASPKGAIGQKDVHNAPSSPESMGATILVLLRTLNSLADNKESWRTISDSDLNEGREICDLLNRKLRDQQFERVRDNPFRR